MKNRAILLLTGVLTYLSCLSQEVKYTIAEDDPYFSDLTIRLNSGFYTGTAGQSGALLVSPSFDYRKLPVHINASAAFSAWAITDIDHQSGPFAVEAGIELPFSKNQNKGNMAVNLKATQGVYSTTYNYITVQCEQHLYRFLRGGVYSRNVMYNATGVDSLVAGDALLTDLGSIRGNLQTTGLYAGYAIMSRANVVLDVEEVGIRRRTQQFKKYIDVLFAPLSIFEDIPDGVYSSTGAALALSQDNNLDTSPWGFRLGMKYETTNPKSKKGRLGTFMGFEGGILPGIQNGEDPRFFERPLFVEVYYGISFFQN